MKMIIGGIKKDASDGAVIKIFNPATGEFIDTVPAATASDVELALDCARKGFKAWSATPLNERARILGDFARAAKGFRKELGTLSCREMGKTITEAEGEVGSIVSLFGGYAEKALHLYGITMPLTGDKGMEDDLFVTIREPLGVVVCIVPFNYPVDLFAHKVAPALVMGNSVIVKPPSSNPLAIIRLVELLHEHGVPVDALQVLTGSGAKLGAILSASPKVDAISFTGSTPVGIEIAKAAAANMTRVFLECGGNDPLLVFEDADLEETADELVRARVTNAGQTCCATKRVIVQATVRDKLAGMLADRLKKVKAGDPAARDTVLSCAISEEAAKEAEAQIAATVTEGAKVSYGGKRRGAFLDATILVGVTPEMGIAKNLEVFGPVFPFIDFKTEDEAVEIANASQFGLQGGVMTADYKRAIRVAARLQCGGVVINGSGMYRSATMPFGGYKKSGIGREGISHTLEEMSQVKTIVFKNVFKGAIR
jgi:succinate-semialdehyde dehydrogenase/glutarate-semialdehyde dehydrogenase